MPRGYLGGYQASRYRTQGWRTARWRSSLMASYGRRLAVAAPVRRAVALRLTGGRRNGISGMLASRGFRPVGQRLPQEKKEQLTTIAGVAIAATGTLDLINGLTAGTGFQNRIGRQVSLKSVYMRYKLALNVPDITAGSLVDRTSPPQLCRMILFVDSQPNGAAPATTDLLVAATTTSQLNLNNRDRFTILVDKVYNFGAQMADAASGLQLTTPPWIQHFEVYKKIGIKTTFNAGNAGTVADINTNSLYQLFICDNGAVAANAVVYTGTTRLRFTDD